MHFVVEGCVYKRNSLLKVHFIVPKFEKLIKNSTENLFEFIALFPVLINVFSKTFTFFIKKCP